MSFEALVGIVGQRWISQGNLAIGTASVGTEGLSIGPTCFGTEAQVSLSGDRLTIIREGWRLDAYRRYRPLVYYAAFGRDEVFDCLRQALASLFEFGAYDGEVLLLTDRAHETWTHDLDPAIRDRVTVRIVEAQDMLDWMLARYRIAAMAEFAAYRPLLYLDIDVVANAPLTRLLQRLAVSTLLHAPAENSVIHPADYYGASLLAADGVAVPAERPGFSAGIMGFPDLATAAPLFALVPDLAEAYARRIGSRTRFACFDQPFANYAAVKSGGVELRLLREFLDNRWFWLDRPTARRGLVHFTGGADKPGEKRAAMAAYLDSLRAG
jgi:hypothetical protein